MTISAFHQFCHFIVPLGCCRNVRYRTIDILPGRKQFPLFMKALFGKGSRKNSSFFSGPTTKKGALLQHLFWRTSLFAVNQKTCHLVLYVFWHVGCWLVNRVRRVSTVPVGPPVVADPPRIRGKNRDRKLVHYRYKNSNK